MIDNIDITEIINKYNQLYSLVSAFLTSKGITYSYIVDIGIDSDNGSMVLEISHWHNDDDVDVYSFPVKEVEEFIKALDDNG